MIYSKFIIQIYTQYTEVNNNLYAKLHFVYFSSSPSLWVLPIESILVLLLVFIYEMFSCIYESFSSCFFSAITFSPIPHVSFFAFQCLLFFYFYYVFILTHFEISSVLQLLLFCCFGDRVFYVAPAASAFQFLG